MGPWLHSHLIQPILHLAARAIFWNTSQGELIKTSRATFRISFANITLPFQVWGEHHEYAIYISVLYNQEVSLGLSQIIHFAEFLFPLRQKLKFGWQLHPGTSPWESQRTYLSSQHLRVHVPASTELAICLSSYPLSVFYLLCPCDLTGHRPILKFS